jgi:mannosyltransferase OCH1-like enzyme
MVPYTAEAYQAKKYAFVSDYARFWILYHYGGVYFDTDVEVIKPMCDLLAKGAFMGIEVEAGKDNPYPLVAPGLGIAVEQKHPFYKKLLDYYSGIHFYKEDGTLNQVTVVRHTSYLLVKEGMKADNQLQCVSGIWIYPVDFLNPLDDLTGKLNITCNTRTIHWYSRTWQNQSPIIQWLSRMSHRIFGMRLHRLKILLNN